LNGAPGRSGDEPKVNCGVLRTLRTILAQGLARETLLSGGYEFDYGQAYRTVIRGGGNEVVLAGARDAGSLIGYGGKEVVSSGGAADEATVFAGGALIVSSGGSLVGGLAIRAGEGVISGTIAAGQTVDFTGTAGMLALDNLAGFRAVISGLSARGQEIDLGGFAYGGSKEAVSWTQSGTSGTLTVSDGAQTAHLTLIGTATSSWLPKPRRDLLVRPPRNPRRRTNPVRGGYGGLQRAVPGLRRNPRRRSRTD
jgi:autotransporter passenger strand-loop-strand repeat protein